MLVAHQTATVSLSEFLSMRIKVENFVLFGGFLLVWHIVFSSFGVYSSKRLSARWAEVLDVAKAATLGSGIIYVAAIPLRIEMVTPLFLLFFWTTSVLGGAASRVVLRGMLGGIRRRGRNLREMVVVGTNARALRFARRIESRPELGYRIAGFVDVPWLGLGMFQQTGYRLVSDFSSFPRFLREQVVDEVVIALPMESSYGQAARIAGLCEEQGIIVRMLSDMFNLRLAHSRAEEFEGVPVTTLATGSPDGWPHFCKRALDIVVSLAAMLRAFAGVFAGLDRRQAHLEGAGLVLSGARRLGQAPVLPVQVPHHGGERARAPVGGRAPERGGRPGVQDQGRPAPHPRREVPEEDEHR